MQKNETKNQRGLKRKYKMRRISFVPYIKGKADEKRGNRKFSFLLTRSVNAFAIQKIELVYVQIKEEENQFTSLPANAVSIHQFFKIENVRLQTKIFKFYFQFTCILLRFSIADLVFTHMPISSNATVCFRIYVSLMEDLW